MTTPLGETIDDLKRQLAEANTRIRYLEAQESLLEEWQQKYATEKARADEVVRPLDAQMARLNESLIIANGRAETANIQLAYVRSDLEIEKIESAHQKDTVFALEARLAARNQDWANEKKRAEDAERQLAEAKVELDDMKQICASYIKSFQEERAAHANADRVAAEFQTRFLDALAGAVAVQEACAKVCDKYASRAFDGYSAQQCARYIRALDLAALKAGRELLEPLKRDAELMHIAICQAVSCHNQGEPTAAAQILRQELIRRADAAIAAGEKP